jgi:hypothetical protein
MQHFKYDDSPVAIRDDLKQVYRDYWQLLAGPGNWWTGAERVAIALESRNAVSCNFCAERKQALSPYSFPGEHQHDGSLDALTVDAVHRIITDQGRITQAWIDGNVEQGLSEEKYVELLGVVVTVFSIDEFNRGLGLPAEPLPEPMPMPGEPNRYRPALAERGTGFVSMLPSKGGAVGKESDLWPDGRGANVLRAMSLVPDAVRGWYLVASGQYLTMKGMGNLSGDLGRSLNRMQMEIVAGRVSSINECFY